MRRHIVLTRYTLDNQPLDLRIALVADLHERDSSEIIALLKGQKPDVIFVVGDTFERQDRGVNPRAKEKHTLLQKMAYLLAMELDDLADRFVSDKSGKSVENAYSFFRAAVRIAPVYMSLGNHEWYLKEEDRRVLAECGVTLLDNADTEICVKNRKIISGGLSTGYDLEWLRSFAAKPGYKILLSHHPEYYEKIIKNTGKFDLILSGHAHGGQWRIGKRGVFAPGQGLFPKYSHGVYKIQGGKLIVSAGCSNTASIPRFGNPCELVLIEFSG